MRLLLMVAGMMGGFLCDVCAQESVSTDSLHCNTMALLEVNQQLADTSSVLIPYETVLLFYQTFAPSCINNAEYSQWSSELLFDMLYHAPGTSLRILTHPRVNQAHVLDEIAHPLLDENIPLLRVRIVQAGGPVEIAQAVLRALADAAIHLQEH